MDTIVRQYIRIQYPSVDIGSLRCNLVDGTWIIFNNNVKIVGIFVNGEFKSMLAHSNMDTALIKEILLKHLGG